MTDKVQKIREEVIKIVNSINLFKPDEDGKNSSYEAGKLDVASEILQVIDSLQEEPVSEQKLSNVERIEKNWKEESDLNWKDMSLQEKKDLLVSLQKDIEPASEDLEEAAEEYAYTNWQSDDYHEGAADDGKGY